MLKLSILKLLSRRNLYFSIAFLLFTILCTSLFFYESDKISSINGIVKLFENFFYIWLLGIFSSEIDSGLMKKQISNGASRSEILYQFLITGFLFTSLFYLIEVIFIFILSKIEPSISQYPFKFIGITYLAYISLVPIALLISLFLKTTAKTVLIGHFLIKHILAFPTALLYKKTFNEFYLLASPQGLSQQVIYGTISLESYYVIPMLIFYLLLFVFLNKLRIKKINLL